MTTKKRKRGLPALAVISPHAGALLTACSPPGGRDLREGAREINAGEFAAAIPPLTAATHALSSAPPAEQSKALNLLGVAYHGAGQLDAASQTYLQALKLDHNHEAIDFNLGCLRMEQSNFPGAIDYFTTCVALNPHGVDGYLKLGAARYHLALEKTGSERAKQMENARHEFDAAEKLRPTAEAANAIGMMEMQRRNGGAEAARAAAADFQTALERDPHYGPALLNLGIVDQQYLNQLSKALQLYLQYLALQPLPPHAKEVAKLVRHTKRGNSRHHWAGQPVSSPAPAPPGVCCAAGQSDASSSKNRSRSAANLKSVKASSSTQPQSQK